MILQCEIYKKILEYHNNIIVVKDMSYIDYYHAYKRIAYDSIEVGIADYYNMSIVVKNSSIDITKNQYDIVKSIQKKIPINYYLINLKVYEGNYYELQNQFDKAYNSYFEAFTMNSQNKFGFEILPKIGAKLNIGYIITKQNNIKKVSYS